MIKMQGLKTLKVLQLVLVMGKKEPQNLLSKGG